MTGDQIWGVVGVVVGTGTILLRKYISVGGREVDQYEPDNNLANPNRRPTARQDQRVAIISGAIVIGAGLLYIFGLVPLK